jgi:hypothetical protein
MREVMKAAVDVIRQTDTFVEFRGMGSGFESLQGANRRFLKASMRKLGTKRFLTPGDLWEMGLELVGSFNDLIETSPRLAVYKKVRDTNMAEYRKTAREGMTDIEKQMFSNLNESDQADYLDMLYKARKTDIRAKLEAIYESNDVTVNFGKEGRAADIAQITPFFTAGVQGLDKFYRAFVSDKEHRKEHWIKAIVTVTFLALLEYLINDDDEEYHKLPNYIRDNYWILPDPLASTPGKYIKMRKPREMGFLFSALPQRTLNEIFHAEEDNGVALKEAFLYAFMPPVRTVVAPIHDVMRNKKWSGEPINSVRYESSTKHNKYDDTTSRIGVGTADFLYQNFDVNVSPLDIDYLIKSYTGGIGQVALPVATPAYGGLPALPSVIQRRMTADNAYSNRFVNEFYDKLNDLQNANKDLNDLMQREGALKPNQNMTANRAKAFINEYDGKLPKHLDEKTREYATHVSNEMSDKWAEIRALNNDDELNYKERQAKIREVRLEINDLAEKAVEKMKVMQTEDED